MVFNKINIEYKNSSFISSRNRKSVNQNEDLVSKNDEIHFTKNMLEILNKLLTYSKLEEQQSFFNNKKFYELVKECLCNFYAERYMSDVFDRILSEENIVSYLQSLELILFDSNQKSVHNFDRDDSLYYDLAFSVINERIPCTF